MWNAFSSRIIVAMNGKMNSSSHGVKGTDDGKLKTAEEGGRNAHHVTRRAVQSIVGAFSTPFDA
jgi:hypothetical protein